MKNKKKIDKFNLITSLLFLSFFSYASYDIGKEVYKEYKIEHSKELDTYDIKNAIYNSSNLTNDEKKFLYDTDFFKDVLETINDSKIERYSYLKRFDNMDIKDLNIDELDDFYCTEYICGYYDYKKLNNMFIKNYSNLSGLNKDFVAHEFVHLCESHPLKYNVIIEAATETIASEYFNNYEITAYQDIIKFLKVLMEMIGPTPIWNYCFLGDFSLIEDSVSIYLTEEEYNLFKECLICDVTNIDVLNNKLEILNNLLEKIYYNKYNMNIKDDKIIDLIRNDASLKRYYFNKQFINEENSYYLYINEVCYTKDEAAKIGYVTFLYNDSKITYEEYLNLEDKTNICYYINGILDKEEDDLLYFITIEKEYIPTIYERINKTKQLIK